MKKQRVSKKRTKRRLQSVRIPMQDWLLAAVVLILTLFGVVMVYNTSVIVAFEEFGDKFWFFKNQLIWAGLGVTGMMVLAFFDYKQLQKLAFPAFVVSIILLLLVLIPGVSNEVYGARQRILIPGLSVSIQPGELVKLTLVMYLAYLFSEYKKKTRLPFPHKQFFIALGTVLILVAVEPDLGSAMLIMGMALIMYFTAGAPLLYLALISGFGVLMSLLYAYSSDYRRDRIFTFLNPLHDPQGVSYQIMQVFIALGSGGLFGVGLGNSRQKYQYIPEVTTDSIFAILGEELGFIGVLLLLGAFMFIIWRGFSIAKKSTDDFGRLLAIGFISNIGIQAVVNLGGMVGLMPLTGVPLPFISYGGSSMTLLLFSVGILLNISGQSNTSSKKR